MNIKQYQMKASKYKYLLEGHVKEGRPYSNQEEKAVDDVKPVK